jgi:hypothetical protein
VDDLTFTPHALQEMSKDNITQDDVYVVVRDADDVIKRDDGRTIFIPVIEDGRQLVAAIEDETRVVETVWWTKRGSRGDVDATGIRSSS